MELERIQEVLKKIEDGTVISAEGLELLAPMLQQDLKVQDYADIDLNRGFRQGMPEVIYGEGKTAEQIAGIAAAMAEREIGNIMITRLSAEKAREVGKSIPIDYEAIPRIGFVNRRQNSEKIGKIAVVAAGTSDLPVAEEAAVTAENYGNNVVRIYDVGVAGLHRLLHRLPDITDANVVIAVAGMEGALVSVVGGLVSCPVIGVPTSVGYGANLHGIAALLSMLNSCASGVSIVNIDNGFGAGVLASKINRQSSKEEGRKILLWDLDGTLTESGPGITNSVRYALKQMGIDETDQGKLDRFVGPPLQESFKKYYGMTPEEAEEAVVQYRVYFRNTGMFENSVYEGVKETLEKLRSEGYVLAVATSKPEIFTIQIMEHFGIRDYFSVIGGSTMDCSRIRKRDVIAYVLGLLGVRKEDRVLMIGDRENDVEGAAANGIPCLGVLYGYGSAEELENAGADALSRDAASIPEAVDELFRKGLKGRI